MRGIATTNAAGLQVLGSESSNKRYDNYKIGIDSTHAAFVKPVRYILFICAWICTGSIGADPSKAWAIFL